MSNKRRRQTKSGSSRQRQFSAELKLRAVKLYVEEGWPADETRAVSVRPGVRHVRAVNADGQSASVRSTGRTAAGPIGGDHAGGR